MVKLLNNVASYILNRNHLHVCNSNFSSKGFSCPLISLWQR